MKAVNDTMITTVDVGGSHISSAVVNTNSNEIVEGSFFTVKIDSDESAKIILDKLIYVIDQSNRFNESKELKIHLAFPGPFEYEKGISKITGVGKFESLFGVNVKEYLRVNLEKHTENIHFVNDATAYALGVYHLEIKEKYQNILVLTLGTGFGSTFINNGIPGSEFLFDKPYRESIADDYFSTRWFVSEYNSMGNEKISNVKELYHLAENNDQNAIMVFETFGRNLGEFLSNSINDTCQVCIIGGNISKARKYFDQAIKDSLNINIEYSIGEIAPLIGAANLPFEKESECERRKTTQFLIPEKKNEPKQSKYDIYPTHKINTGFISSGYKGLTDEIVKHGCVLIDGYAGVFWKDIINEIGKELKGRNINVNWINASVCMMPENVIDRLVEPYLGGDDPLFGRRTDLELTDLFDYDQMEKITLDQDFDVNIIYGIGAGLLEIKASVFYVDLPKNELQFRMRAGAITNLGTTELASNKSMYKRFYFVDWIILNEHKERLLPTIHVFIDDQRPGLPVWTHGDTLRNSLKELSENCFRVRPWFEPGPWGGTWMKDNIEGLSEDVPNYAWSFEMIVPENGLVLEDKGLMLEFSFDFLMFQEYKNVLGEAAERFETEFPIRFDYLDTFDGGNLSVQVHPKQDYFVKEFGEKFTQDECYYMLDTKNSAKVYLGFQEGVDSKEFRNKLEESFEKSTEVEIDKYVQSAPANKHDLFLIPNGTIHGSGKDNLVLEISSTPYIFTFKLYDWLRLDLEGNPRPLNIERGFKNLEFSRQGNVITEEHISRPVVIENGENWELIHLPTHREHFYDVHRYDFSEEVDAQTNNQCHVMMLVEGTSIIIETKNGLQQRYNFAETFVIPAACKEYKIINESEQPCKVVKAFVKSESC